MMRRALILGSLAIALAVPSLAFAQNGREKKMYRFDFGAGIAAASGWQKVTHDTAYSAERGFGILEGSPKPAGSGGGNRDGLISDMPFTFAVAVPPGNYDVILILGTAEEASETIVQAESRRLMRIGVPTQGADSKRLAFTVNVRTPVLKSGGQIGLKGDEKNKRDWDEKLTLTFGGKRPAVSSVEIRAAPDAVTVYLAGDSTVMDQEDEPWCAWGQILPAFFGSGVAVANHAQSGESLGSFSAERRWDKILETLRAGDYVFIQFAHNDQKSGANHADPLTTYPDQLKAYADAVRKRSATPVFVTPMHRRRFDAAGKIINTLGEYPDAMRRLARAENAALIDLHAMSATLFEAMGPERSKEAFVHYPANTFPGQSEPLKDDTHFNNYGGYELARCVVEGIRKSVPTLAKRLRKNTETFDPAKPDSLSPLATLTATKKGI